RSVSSKNSGLNETCSSQPKTSRLIHPTGAREVKCSLPLSAPDVVPIGSEAPPQTAETRSASGSASLPPVLACPPSRGLDISEGEPNRSHKTCLIRDDLRLRRCLGSQSALEPRALSSEAPPPASTSSFVNLWRWHPRQNLGRITRVRGVQALNRPNLTKVRACVNSRQPLALLRSARVADGDQFAADYGGGAHSCSAVASLLLWSQSDWSRRRLSRRRRRIRFNKTSRPMRRDGPSFV